MRQGFRFPVVMGNEFAGVVRAVGAGAMALALGLALVGGSWSCTHAPTKAPTAASTMWTESDSSETATDLASRLEKSAFARDFAKKNPGKKPKLLVGDFENRTDRHLDMGPFVKLLESSLAKGGKFQVTKAKKTAELLLTGNISESVHAVGDGKVVTYQVVAALTNVKTLEVEWTSKREVKKKGAR